MIDSKLYLFPSISFWFSHWLFTRRFSRIIDRLLVKNKLSEQLWILKRMKTKRLSEKTKLKLKNRNAETRELKTDNERKSNWMQSLHHAHDQKTKRNALNSNGHNLFLYFRDTIHHICDGSQSQIWWMNCLVMCVRMSQPKALLFFRISDQKLKRKNTLCCPLGQSC